ncbi:aminopeptidase [Paenibacillus mucilaginosus]|uniref:AmpS n=2 Tax=Paenibacillus mucilaginosus TaxID=61624 RepID=H6NS86_9BACL|nr:aminopeptidase [Paenibacillus mucilaginosus]AEI39088.1 AmpS [Paenibacillus mucilaginosus KNP414]AFC27380.1 AmpS [Paenibacillus mucilaginosus 3016]MCG7216214.1 aminopeptidase [Paenibacillus mucilaginosus]WDM28114.1 aminopeptidase [Paenibacillus mucilaginosus]WFA16290.1 aminopeptidase [Paenibacillus mucilaginosus]
MSNFQELLSRYAELIVKTGVKIQKGQKLVVNSTIDAAELVRLITKHAYEEGAYLVKVNWTDDTITRLRYDMAPEESFLEEPKWYAGEMLELAENGAAVVSITSSDPDLLKGVPQSRIMNHQKTYGKAMHQFRQYMQSDKFSWCVAAAPSKAWAAKVFPGLSEEEQVAKLWEAILRTVRVDREDPVAAWEEHIRHLNAKSDFLNEKKFKKLHYTAPGTDLTIELPEGHLWVAADSINEKGISFLANMPTEEVFTAPRYDGVNGTVSSTKPLSYGGNLIDNFKLTFENGKIVDVSAEQGEDTLRTLIDMDEGARYLGEVALVPHESPISQSGLLFYNTLFDENASNHLAIGSAYAFNLEGGKGLSQEELKARGLNTSITHVDFMIGSAEMDIDGITADGTTVPLFRKGNWAI